MPEVIDKLNREVASQTNVGVVGRAIGIYRMAVVPSGPVEKVIHTDIDFSKTVAEQLLPDEHVAIDKPVIVQPVHIKVLLEMYRAGQHKPFPEDPFGTSQSILRKIIVPVHTIPAGKLIAGVSRIVGQGEI